MLRSPHSSVRTRERPNQHANEARCLRSRVRRWQRHPAPGGRGEARDAEIVARRCLSFVLGLRRILVKISHLAVLLTGTSLAVGAFNLVQAAQRQSNPCVGTTCKLPDAQGKCPPSYHRDISCANSQDAKPCLSVCVPNRTNKLETSSPESGECKSVSHYGVHGCEPLPDATCKDAYQKQWACPPNPNMKAPCYLECIPKKTG
jgi:hypothetical protein